MKTTERNNGWKVVAIFALVLIGMLGLMAQPVDNMNQAAWMSVLLISKAIGLAAFYGAGRLAGKWFGVKFNY